MYLSLKELVFSMIFWMVIFGLIALGGKVIGGDLGSLIFFGALIAGGISIYKFIKYMFDQQADYSKIPELSNTTEDTTFAEVMMPLARLSTTAEIEKRLPSKKRRDEISKTLLYYPTNLANRKAALDWFRRGDIREYVKWLYILLNKVADHSLGNVKKFDFILKHRYSDPGDEELLEAARQYGPIYNKKELVTAILTIETYYLDLDPHVIEIFQEAIDLELKLYESTSPPDETKEKMELGKISSPKWILDKESGVLRKVGGTKDYIVGEYKWINGEVSNGIAIDLQTQFIWIDEKDIIME